MRARHVFGVCSAVSLLILPARIVLAQTPEPQTRQTVIAQAQADKQQRLAPPRRNRGEILLDRLEDMGLITGHPRGLYPVIDSIYPGGGFAGGVGVRQTFGDDGAVNVLGAYSLSRFWHVQTEVSLPTFAHNRARVSLAGRYLDAPDVKYYGVGNDSVKEDQTRFGYSPRGGGARLDFEASRYISLGGGVNYIDIETSAGRTAPSIETRFSPADTPGLARDHFDYINSSARARVDWRRSPGYTGKGGSYQLQFDDYRDRDDDGYSFRSLEAEVLQLIPLLRANWVIALRGVGTVTDIDDTDAVPYFMLPSLGGGGTLRGYPDFRFRDRHRLLMNAELRWTPARFMDMALFYDTGKVTSRRKDLDFDDLQDSYGLGMRLIGFQDYIFRVEVAHSREHAARLLFSAGAAF